MDDLKSKWTGLLKDKLSLSFFLSILSLKRQKRHQKSTDTFADEQRTLSCLSVTILSPGNMTATSSEVGKLYCC